MRTLHFSYCIALACLLSCSTDSHIEDCTSDNTISLGHGSCLVLNNQADLANISNLLINETTSSFRMIQAELSVENLVIRIEANARRVIPEIGIGGYNPNEHEIQLFIDPDYPDLIQSIKEELGPQLAHETHHAMRRRATGYGNTLLGALISEGLADRFSVELFQIAPPIWSSALTDSELETWQEQAKQTWRKASYNHNAWFFGSNEIPRWTGYSLGYKLVSDYLDRHPGTTAASLVGTQSTVFIDNE